MLSGFRCKWTTLYNMRYVVCDYNIFLINIIYICTEVLRHYKQHIIIWNVKRKYYSTIKYCLCGWVELSAMVWCEEWVCRKIIKFISWRRFGENYLELRFNTPVGIHIYIPYTCTHVPIYELYFVRYARKDVFSYTLSTHCSTLI